MAAWWETLTGLQQALYCVAIPATLVLFIQFLLSVIGLAGDSDFDTGDMDGDIDFDTDVDFDGDGFDMDMDGEIDTNFTADGTDVDTADITSADFRFVSFRTVIAFLTVFPWTVLVLLGKGMNTPLAILIGVLAGLLAMFVIGYLFYITAKLQSSGNIDYKNAVGQMAEVYIPLLKENSYKGKVQVMIQDRLVEASAMANDEKNHSTGEMVHVVGVLGPSTLIVKSIKK